MDAVAMAERVAANEITATELVEQAIERSENVHSQINAVVRTTYDQARKSATEVDAVLSGPGRGDSGQAAAGGASPSSANPAASGAGLPDSNLLSKAGSTRVNPSGRLAGVPFLTKDLGCTTAGEPHFMGNAALKEIDYRASDTSYLTTMLCELGMINLGYTNTPEFGLTVTTEPLSYGATANPWNLDHSAGGSSGGSAAAVAAGVVPIGQGGDGGGSIRVPAANCGIFGLKPGRGRVSSGPDAGEGWAGASTGGVMSRSVRDSAVALDGICHPWPGDPYWAPLPTEPFETAVDKDPPPLRVGIAPYSGWGDVHTECVSAVEGAGKLLESLGHSVEYSMPEALFDERLIDDFLVVVSAANVVTLDHLSQALGREVTRQDVEGDTWALANIGRNVSGAQYLEGLSAVHAYTRAMLTWWSDYDILVTPVLAEPPPRLGELREPGKGSQRLADLLQFTRQFNVTGQPGMSVPLHWTPEGLPVGVQFVGAQCTEYQLLQLAGQLERAAPWEHRRPPIWAD